MSVFTADNPYYGLLQRLKNKEKKSPDYTRSLIKKKLAEDYDCEIATTSLQVSLVCPLGKMRMVCPCRSAACPHLQCFDASHYLQMNEKKPTWLCPVCDRRAPYESLIVDGYFQDVLSSPRLAADCNEIQLHKDGSWSAHTPPPRVSVLISDGLEVKPLEGSGAKGENRTAKPTTPAADTLMLDFTFDLVDELPRKGKASRAPTPITTAATLLTTASRFYDII